MVVMWQRRVAAHHHAWFVLRKSGDWVQVSCLEWNTYTVKEWTVKPLHWILCARALRILLAFSQPVNCVFWPIETLNWLVAASKLHKHRGMLHCWVALLSIRYTMVLASWEICHRCAKVLLAAEHKIQLAYYLRNTDWFQRCSEFGFFDEPIIILFTIFLLISVKEWYNCQLLIFSSDDIVCWSKFPNFDLQVGCQKLSAMLNLRLIEYWKI